MSSDMEEVAFDVGVVQAKGGKYKTELCDHIYISQLSHTSKRGKEQVVVVIRDEDGIMDDSLCPKSNN